MFHRLYGVNILSTRIPPEYICNIIFKKLKYIDVFKCFGLDTNIQCLGMYLSDQTILR